MRNSDLSVNDLYNYFLSSRPLEDIFPDKDESRDEIKPHVFRVLNN